MTSAAYSLLLFIACYILGGDGCKVVEMSSTLGTMRFHALSESNMSGTGRPSFHDQNAELYLFHGAPEMGRGRWCIAQELFHDMDCVAFIDSWSVHPTQINFVHDPMVSIWLFVDDAGGWKEDSSVNIACSSRADGSFADSTFFFDSGSSFSGRDISGFFVEVEKSLPTLSAGPLYVLTGRPDLDSSIFMYRWVSTASAVWVIGQDVGTDIGIAYTSDEALEGSHVLSQEWNVLNEGRWVVGNCAIYAGSFHSDVFTTMRRHRSLQSVPHYQDYYNLRNQLPFPAVGLGTGGLRQPEASIEAALRSDYRLLDLAREYRNEDIVGNLFKKYSGDETFPTREEVFIISKVWPTDLGFHPTTDAIYQTLTDLKTNYVDSYLLHWPACYHHIEWMRCGDIVEADATWRDSWRALEKAYAEGLVISIGVSNFGLELMNEIWQFANVRPHIVQNFADPSNLDLHVRDFCYVNEILYVPYAIQRNYNFLSSEIKTKLSNIANFHDKSPNDVILKMFLQSHAAVIPRSDNVVHLLANIQKLFEWHLNDDEMIDLGWPPGSDEEVNEL